MSWRESLREASFRGVRFEVESVEASYGRRKAVHKFPLRDLPQIQDLGGNPDAFSIEAYVIGRDYMAARDALIAALNEPGPGVLVEQYRGEINVEIIGDFRVRESSREGGMAIITFSAIEAEEASYPQMALATADTLDAAADQALAAQGAGFGEAFSVDGFPDYLSALGIDQVIGYIDQAKDLVARVGAFAQPLADFANLASSISSELSSLIRAPSLLASRLTGMMSLLSSSFTSPLSALDGLGELFGFDAGGSGGGTAPPGTPTPARAQLNANTAALSTLVQSAAVIEATRVVAQIRYGDRARLARTRGRDAGTVLPTRTLARSAPELTAVDIPSRQEADALRDRLVIELDRIAELAPSDTAYYAVTGLRAAVVVDIATRGANLAEVDHIVLPEITPALSLAWSQYGDARADQDIIGRNRIADPLAVPAGVALEVLR